MKRGGKSRVVRKPAEVATSLLDAYTESQSTSSMSDSDKFKEGYVKKKDKGKQKRTSKKSETEDDQEQELREEDVEMKESWEEEEEVIESWETIEVEEMPVPQKVKQVMRKEEKKRKKEEKKAAEKEKSDEPPVASQEDDAAEDREKTEKTETLTESIKELSVEDKDDGKKKEFSEDEKAAIKAEREAKKAAKAAKAAKAKATSKNANVEPAAVPTENPEIKDKADDPAPAEGEKTKAQLKAERKAQFEQQQKLKATEQSDDKPGEKSKAELKAERRAKQEAQRKAKAEGQEKKTQEKKTQEEKPASTEKKTLKKVEKKAEKETASRGDGGRGKGLRQVGLFSHLKQYERRAVESVGVDGGETHPAILEVGLQHADCQVVGSSGRCVTLLLAIKSLLLDSVPRLALSNELHKDVDHLIDTNMTFLKQCRQMSISMTNAIRYVKREIRQIEKNVSADDLRSSIEEIIDDFININFTLHPKAISETANKKIRNGDVILTYSYSKLVEKALLDAAEAGKKIKVIVADGRLQSLGRNLSSKLVAAGIHTTYILITAVSQLLANVTKVLLGCDGVMANGCVLATVGTSQVALLAKSCNKPVIFCSETYKFTERVQTDSFVNNELLDPEDVVKTGREGERHLADWKDQNSLCLLNLVYDLTPASLVDSIVTEISEIPPTSVPVVLRLHSHQTT